MMNEEIQNDPAGHDSAPQDIEPTAAPESSAHRPASDEPLHLRTGSRSTVSPARKGLLLILQVLTYLLLLVAVAAVALVARERLLDRQAKSALQVPVEQTGALAAETSTEVSEPQAQIDSPDLPVLFAPAADQSTVNGIERHTLLETTIPTRPRVDVITYTVQKGDTLFVIADNFGLKPETILWGNFDVLEDNPHLLKPDQVLNILPVNGTYYQWNDGDTLKNVADFFKVEPQIVLDYPGNRFDLGLASVDQIDIEPGTWLIIPGGKRAIKDWGPPAISRTNPAAASYYGPGHCGSIYSGAIGNGSFIWPTTSRLISGYSYNPGVHPAIDIAGAEGNAVYATDGGVVVYAGWSNYGYGYLIVIDHGNGWQSAYAHLSALSVGCGQSVFQGGSIGAVGNTGNSYGSHLHFELVYGGAKLNPFDFLQ